MKIACYTKYSLLIANTMLQKVKLTVLYVSTNQVARLIETISYDGRDGAAQHPNVPIQKAKYLTCEKNTCQKNDFASDCITRFKEKVREGPFYICTVCHRSLYQRSVKPVGVSTYPRTDLFTAMKSFDNLEYICHTCHNSVKKNKTPCQSVKN